MRYEKLYTTDTLDFHNFNEPFRRAELNFKKLSKDLSDILLNIENTRIYTDTDKITLITNGVKDKFYIDESNKIIKLESDVTLKFDSFLKKSTGSEVYSYIEPLNLEEISMAMLDDGFLKKRMSFKAKILKADFFASNMMSIDEIDNTSFREGSTVSVDSMENINIDGTVTDSSVLNVQESKKLFFHKLEPYDSVKFSTGNITEVKADRLDGTLEFSTSATFTNPDSNISVKEAKSICYEHGSPIQDQVSIDNPGKNAPINKNSIDSIFSLFVTVQDKMFKKLGITREYGASSTLPDDSILMKEETEGIIDAFFDQLISPTIDTIDEYETIMNGLCQVGDDDFIDKDFNIPGGKVYLGFDYDNMSSVLNSRALRRIFTGEDGPEIGKTLMASSYLKDVSVLQSFLEIGELLGYSIDMSKASSSDLIQYIKDVTTTICKMNISALLGDKEIPKISVGSFKKIFVRPMLDSFSVGYMDPLIRLPFFINIPKELVIVEPSISILFQGLSIAIPLLVEPSYNPDVNAFTIQGPSSIGFSRSSIKKLPLLQKPQNYEQINYRLFSASKQLLPTGGYYDNSNCEKRVKANLYRNINSIDAEAIIAKLTENPVYLLLPEGHALPPAVAIAKMASDIICEINSTVSIADVSIGDFFSKIISTEQTSSSTTSPSGCMTAVSSTDLVKEDTKLSIDGADFINNKGEATVHVRKTELFSVGELTIESWTTVGSDEYIAKLSALSVSIKTSIDNYFNPISYEDMNTGVKPELKTLKTKDEIVLSGESTDIMAEYLDFYDPRDGFSKSTTGNSNGDFTSFEGVPSGLEDKYGYGVYHMASSAARAFCQGSDIAVPHFASGDIEYFFFFPDSNQSSEISNLPYGKYGTLSDCVKAGERVSVVIKSGSDITVMTSGSNAGYIVTNQASVKVSSDPLLYKNGTESLFVIIDKNNEYKVLYLGFNVTASVSLMGVVDCEDPRVPMFEMFNDRNILGGVNQMIGGSVDFNNPFAGLNLARFSNSSPRGLNLKPSVAADNGECDGATSEINPGVFENISSLRHIDPDTPSSWNDLSGKVPANISFNLHANISGYALGTFAGLTSISSKDSSIIIPVSIGTIDGYEDDVGDILAQGKSPEEVADMNVTEANVKYICGGKNCSFVSETEDYTEYEMNVEDVLSKYSEDIEMPGGTYAVDGNQFAISQSSGPEQTSIIDANVAIQGGEPTARAAGTILLSGLGISSMQYSFKHEGSDPKYPIATSSSGFQETVLVNGNKIVSTLSTSMPTIMSSDEFTPNEHDFFSFKIAGNILKMFVKKSQTPYGGPGRAIAKDFVNPDQGSGNGNGGSGGDTGNYTADPLFTVYDGTSLNSRAGV